MSIINKSRALPLAVETQQTENHPKNSHQCWRSKEENKIEVEPEPRSQSEAREE